MSTNVSNRHATYNIRQEPLNKKGSAELKVFWNFDKPTRKQIKFFQWAKNEMFILIQQEGGVWNKQTNFVLFCVVIYFSLENAVFYIHIKCSISHDSVFSKKEMHYKEKVKVLWPEEVIFFKSQRKIINEEYWENACKIRTSQTI